MLIRVTIDTLSFVVYGFTMGTVCGLTAWCLLSVMRLAAQGSWQPLQNVKNWPSGI